MAQAISNFYLHIIIAHQFLGYIFQQFFIKEKLIFCPHVGVCRVGGGVRLWCERLRETRPRRRTYGALRQGGFRIYRQNFQA